MVTDSWGRTIEYVRISLTEACNFCCPYCRPEEITPESQHNLVSADEWMVILEAYHRLGVRALRLTGGEPLLYPQLEELLQRVAATGWFEDISMTTNGSLLAPKAKRLRQLGLSRVNISLDAVDEMTFDARTGRRGQMENVLAGIEAALQAGFVNVKINTVLMESLSDDSVRALLAYIDRWPVIWRFIEYMPFQGDTFKGPSFEEWRAQLERLTGGELREVRHVHGFGPASYYALPNGREVGFIFPMSHSYCDSCNRVRMTADGKLRLCLLRDDEADIARQVRQGLDSEALAMYIAEALQLRKEKHDGISMDTPQREMWRIGG